VFTIRLLTLSLVVTSAQQLSAQRVESAPRSVDSEIRTSDGTRLHLRVVGSARDTIIAIHGGPGVDLESIANDFAPLTRAHTVIFYDQRGTGRSELPNDTTRLGARKQIQDLDAIRQHFALAKVTLVAHSYGPLLAATYALAYPERVRKMVFFGPLPPRRGDFWKRFGVTMGKRVDSTMQAQLQSAAQRLFDPASDSATIRRACRDYWAVGLKPRLADPVHGAEKIRSDLCASDPAGIRYGLMVTNRVVLASYGNWDLRAGLRQLDVPTLVVHGDKEAIPTDLVREWVTTMPHATLLKVPRAAHFTYAERPDLVWPAVEKFLSRPALSAKK